MPKPRLVVIGSMNMDIVVETKQVPEKGETVLGQKVSFVPGGKGANQAVACARLGAETSIIGAVGDDAFGSQLLNSLEENDVDISGVKKVGGTSSGAASIYLSEGDNRIVVIPGANERLTPDDIDENEDKLVCCDVVLLQLEIPIETVVYAAKKAKSYGKTVLLNPAPAQPLPDEIFSNIDIFTPNETELISYTGLDKGKDSLEVGMKELRMKGVNHIVTTLGEKGSAYLNESDQVEYESGYQVTVVDTTGAGDAFNGALGFAIGEGKKIREALEYASLVSAIAVTKFGAQGGMPTEAEIQAFALEGNKLKDT
ncbi:MULTISPECIES: ribokinase [Bacillaceae]|uniref:Ribokinase n=1 Tax=Evansella alkalicola TaxID=745819 RepID=A0ABS6JND3_9BACI|nr:MULTISPECIES: ribokinase [Bacillaceae]MBU9720077.1 ribokinase [Bacillus alkalicola]